MSTIGFGGSSVAESYASPFVNDASLILGQENTAGGVSGIDTYPSAVATGGAGIPQGDGTTPSTNPQTLTGVLGGLVNNSTFWLAAGALVTLLYFLHRRK
jgi:hypothetical protein